MCHMPSHPLTNHYQPITWHPKIAQHASKALPSQSHPFRTSLCPQSYKNSSGKPLVEQHSSLPLPIRPGNWRSYIAENKISHLFFPSWGECPFILFICIPTPYLFVFHFHSPSQYLLVSIIFCCSVSILDIFHLVPSVEAAMRDFCPSPLTS